VEDRARWLAEERVGDCRHVRALDPGGIDLLDHREAFFAQPPHDAHRPQEARRIVDQVNEGHRRGRAQGDGTTQQQVLHLGLRAGERHQTEAQREHEQRDHYADRLITQERCRDDARRELGARDLDCNQK
jgi:hypothetical protein